MGGYRDFLRYTALSLISLGAVIAFMKILTTYLGDFAIILYRYEGILLPGMLLLVGIISASALHLEPMEFILYPLRWIRFRLQRESRQRDLG